MTTFLAPTPGKTFNTRGSNYTADPNGLIYNVPTGGYDQIDLVNEGCVMLPFVPHAPGRNLLDGGSFTTNPFQRNIAGLQTTASTGISTISSTATFFADRWFAIGGASSSVQTNLLADTSIPGETTSLTWGRTVSNTNTAAIYLGQVLESVASAKAQQQNVVFSFFGRSNSNFSGVTFTAAIIGGTGTNQVGTTMTAGGWTGQTTLGVATITPTATMTRYSVASAAAVAASINQLGVQLSYTPVGSAAVGDNLILNQFQLELGNAPSPFEKRDPATELARCQRFAWVIPEPAGTTVAVGQGPFLTASTATIVLPTPVPMRAAPAVSLLIGSFSVGAAAYVVSTSMLAGAGHTVNAISVKSLAGSTGTAGGAGILSGTGGGGYILASSDL